MVCQQLLCSQDHLSSIHLHPFPLSTHISLTRTPSATPLTFAQKTHLYKFPQIYLKITMGSSHSIPQRKFHVSKYEGKRACSFMPRQPKAKKRMRKRKQENKRQTRCKHIRLKERAATQAHWERRQRVERVEARKRELRREYDEFQAMKRGAF